MPESQPPAPLEVTDLAQALSSFTPPADAPPADPIEGLRQALDRVLARAQATVVPLEQEDSVARSRQAYVASVLRLLDYLLMPPTTMSLAHDQAVVALGYIRHIEGSRLAALQIGRSARDGTLAANVQALREQVRSLAEKRAVVMSEVEARKQLLASKKVGK